MKHTKKEWDECVGNGGSVFVCLRRSWPSLHLRDAAKMVLREIRGQARENFMRSRRPATIAGW